LFQASYTWSKLITNINSPQSGSGISAPGNVLSGGANSNNPLAMRQQYGLAAFNRAHRLVISYSYELPYRHEEGLSGRVLGGWSVSGVTTIQNGAPFTVSDSAGGTIFFGSAAVFGAAGSRAQLTTPVRCNSVGVCASGVPTATSGSNKCRLGIVLPGCGPNLGWINAAAFGPAGSEPCIGGTIAGSCSTSGGGTGFGNSGIGSVTGPGQHNWDIAIVKNTRVTEATSIQFRAEFFNVWNHTQFFNVQNNRNAAAFGTITQTSVPPRVVQFGLKFLF